MSADELPAAGQAARNQPPRPVQPRRPRRLTLDGLSSDGKRLLLTDREGTEYTVEIDPRLRAALSDGPGRRLETQVNTDTSTDAGSQPDSMLRPRDIQARIRAGETPESVAAAARTTVEKVMPYAAPVLAEREHVAQRAQRSSIRRPAGEATPTARTLGDAVAGRLRAVNIDPETVSWDAWRREDGRWTLTGRYESSERCGLAEVTFDQPGNFVILDNDDARWLVGEDVADEDDTDYTADSTELAHEEFEGLARGGRHPRRRLSSVPQEELPLGEDAIELVSDDTGIGAEQPMEAFLDDRPEAEPEHTHEEPPARRAVKKTRGRASVPSWDEIMFGKPE